MAEQIEQVEQTKPVETEPVKYEQPFRPTEKPPGHLYAAPKKFAGTEEEARAEKQAFMSNVQADPNHPYNNGQDPLHELYVNYFTGVCGLAEDKTNPYDKALAEFHDTEAEWLVSLRADAQKDLDILHKAELEPKSKVPADLSEAKCLLLKARVLSISKTLQDKLLLKKMLKKIIGRTKRPSEYQPLFESFIFESDEQAQEEIADTLIMRLDRDFESGGMRAQKIDPSRFGG